MHVWQSEWPESSNNMCSVVTGFHIDNSEESKDHQGNMKTQRMSELKEIGSACGLMCTLDSCVLNPEEAITCSMDGGQDKT